MPRISFETDEETRRRLKAFLAKRGLTVTQVLLWCVGSILNEYIDLSPLWLESELPEMSKAVKVNE